jgi:hypothetical protein
MGLNRKSGELFGVPSSFAPSKCLHALERDMGVLPLALAAIEPFGHRHRFADKAIQRLDMQFNFSHVQSPFSRPARNQQEDSGTCREFEL